MKLKALHIENYRQFSRTTINFENEITILAGANNCGKTSLVELFGKIFGDTSISFCEKDIPITIINYWSDKLLELIIKHFTNDDNKETKVGSLSQELKEGIIPNMKDAHGEVQILEAMKSDSTLINLEVTYSDGENIEKFSDYLMDLDDGIRSFFFQITYSFKLNQFMKLIDIKYEQLNSRIKELICKTNDEEKENHRRYLKELLQDLFCGSFQESYYYTDSNYNYTQVISENKRFKKLFYYKHIIANREIDDERNDKKRQISKSMISYISDDEDWAGLIKKLPDEIIKPLQGIKIKEKIQDKSLKALSSIISQINSTNGGHSEEIILDMDVDEKSIISFLDNITKAKYKIEGYYLDEAAQGLGYNHMIYMHLQIEDYLKKFNPQLVNFFIIEEPEAHMHPQMQRVFMQHLFQYYKNKNMQGMITTHSSEIIKIAEMKILRVIRPSEKLFQKQIYDINHFLNEAKLRKTEIENFYNLLFGINFSNIVFADKIIMYEGDTERMYLQSVINLPDYKKLSQQYVAFVQVGGAYAHWYREIVEFLNIKTLILTDIDYKKTLVKKDDILKSKITNGAIKHFYIGELDKEIGPQSLKEVAITDPLEKIEDDDDNTEVQVEQLYKWQNEKKNILSPNLMINFQGENDAYSRTLEEAMLAKLLSISVGDNICKSTWKKYKRDHLLIFSIPRKENTTEYNIRDIVNATSDNKTDFMYSVIMRNHVKSMLPNYIEEGLTWLMQ